MAWSTRVVALAGLILLAPTVLAAPSGGHFVVDGPVLLPEGSAFEGDLLALFAPESGDLRALTLTAPKVHLYAWEYRFKIVSGPTGTLARHEESLTAEEHNLTGVRLEMVGTPDDSGWVGVFPGSAPRVSFVPMEPVEIQPGEVSTFGNDNRPLEALLGASGSGIRPQDRHYHRVVSEEHLLLQSQGFFRIEGGAAVKLIGPSFRIQSNELDADFATGYQEGEGTLRDASYRWLVLVFPDGVLEFEGGGIADFAVGAGTASWSGTARFSAVRGELRTEDRSSYTATRDAVALEGDFSSSLTPRREADRLLTSLTVAGNLVSTSMEPSTAVLVPAGDGGPSWASLMLFGAVVVGGSAGAAVLVSRRRAAHVAPARQVPVAAVPDDGLQADDCIRFADEAATERRWARALYWAQRAREMAPHNARIRADEGEYLFQMGVYEDAFNAFAQASRLDGAEGYADYRAAQAAAAAGRPSDEVLAWLERALARSPDLVGDLELFQEFAGLRVLPGYESMVQRAYQRLGIDPAQ